MYDNRKVISDHHQNFENNKHKKISCKFQFTNRVLLWRLILEEYSPEMEYIQCKKNIATYELSKLPNNENQKTAQESNYITEIMLEINGISKLPVNIFPVNLKIFDQYQWKYTSLMVKYKIGTYKSGSVCIGSDKDLTL